MRPNSASIEALLIIVLLVFAAEAAMADDETSSKVLSDSSLVIGDSAKSLRAREILTKMDDPESNEVPFLDRFHLTEKFRVEYRQQFMRGDQKVSLKLYGPLVKKRPGIGIKVVGLSLRDHPVEIKGYGNTKKQLINFTILF